MLSRTQIESINGSQKKTHESKKKELNENQSNMQQKFENIIHSLSMKLKSVAMHIPIALSIFH